MHLSVVLGENSVSFSLFSKIETKSQLSWVFISEQIVNITNSLHLSYKRIIHSRNSVVLTESVWQREKKWQFMTAVILDSVLEKRETDWLIFCPENGRKLVFKSHGKLQKKTFLPGVLSSIHRSGNRIYRFGFRFVSALKSYKIVYSRLVKIAHLTKLFICTNTNNI